MNINDKIQTNIPLAPLTTFKIGGPAAFFVAVTEEAELAEAIKWAKAKNLPYFILGGGSNLLISDTGFDGLVIHLKNEELSVDGQALVAGAGARLSDAVTLAAMSGLAGLTWAAGIPGTVGGATRGNAGAFGGEMKDSVVQVKFYDTVKETWGEATAEDCAFAYRTSRFKLKPQEIIWQVKLNLTPGEANILEAEAAAIIEQRLAKQPKLPSAGCVFKNLPASAELKALLQTETVHPKLACGLAVERLGLKGRSVGGAQISSEHANFIVNCQGAKATDVKALIDLVKAEASAKLNLKLEEEIQYLGLF